METVKLGLKGTKTYVAITYFEFKDCSNSDGGLGSQFPIV